MDQEREIQSLKKRISELEDKIQDKERSFTAFGRSYSKVGSPDSDFLIRTKGQVKIQWGSKFIDLIKDGKINVDSKFIYKESKVGVKDGIYIVGEEDEPQVILKIGDTELNLKGEIGTTYVSFQGEQQTTPQQKYTALTNIGFLYKSIRDVDTNSLQNGIVYIEAEQKLYIVQDGALSEFVVSFPNPYNRQFIIQKSDDSKGSILIVGNGIENSLAFDSFYLYTSDEGVYLESDGSIYFKVADQERIVIGQEETIFSNRVTSQMFKSKGATETSGFRLYFKNNQSTLEVDNLIIRNQQDSKNLCQLYPIYWYYKSNLIVSAEIADNLDGPSLIGFGLNLAYQNEFKIGQKVYVYLPMKEGETVYYNQILLPLNIEMINTEEDQNIIFVTIIEDLIDIDLIKSLNMSDVLNQLQGQEVFLISVDGEVTTLIRRKENNIDLIEAEELPQALENEKIITRVGNIGELKLAGRENDKEVPIEGYGNYSKNAAFLKAQYTKEYELPSDDNSSKFASTEWVKKSLKSAITDIVNTDLDLYYPYKDTNDYSILQWMNNIGLSEYLLQLNLGTSVISCKHGQLTIEKNSETNYKIVAWVSAITDDDTISHRSFEFTWDGSNYIYGISTYILFTRYPGYYLSTDKVDNAPQNFYYIGTNKQEVNEVYQYLWNWDGISWQLLNVYMTDDTQYLYIKSTSYSTFILRSVNKYYYVPSGFICYINANGKEVEQGYGKSNYLPVEICQDDDTSIISKLTTLKSFIKSESYNKKPVNENYICLWRIKKEYNRIDYTKWEMLTGYTRQYKLDTEGIALLNCNSPTPEDFKYYKVDSNNKITEEITTMPVDKGTTDNWKNKNWVNTFLIYSISEFLSKNIKYYNPLTGWSFQWDNAYVSGIGGHYGIYFGTPIDPIDDTDNKFPTQSVYQYSGRLIGYGYSVDYYFEGVSIGKKLEGVAGAQNRSIGDVATYLNPLFDIKYTQFYAKISNLLNKTDEFITIKGNT